MPGIISLCPYSSPLLQRTQLSLRREPTYPRSHSKLEPGSLLFNPLCLVVSCPQAEKNLCILLLSSTCLISFRRASLGLNLALPKARWSIWGRGHNRSKPVISVVTLTFSLQDDYPLLWLNRNSQSSLLQPGLSLSSALLPQMAGFLTGTTSL